MVDLAELGVVMPVFNEGSWVDKSIGALELASQRAGWPTRIVVVDDGSTDSTTAHLDALAAAGRITLIRQPNAGRFAARLAGLANQTCEYVLLLDARVLLEPDALVSLRDRVTADPESAWNAHVYVHVEGNVWAAFWSALTKVFWRRYFANPRPVAFGVDEFDHYPKGTGAFAAPRAAIQEAAGQFSSLFDEQNYSSDDTRLLRSIAAHRLIHLDPDFSCEYFGRDSASRWARQVYFRGTTFVDGYVRTRAKAAVVAAALAAAVATLGVVGLRRAALPAAGVVASGWVGVGILATRSGTSPSERRALLSLLPAFGVLFGAGFIRGLALALRKRP